MNIIREAGAVIKIVFVLYLISLLSSCTLAQGPQGLPGKDGTNGIDGQNSLVPGFNLYTYYFGTSVQNNSVLAAYQNIFAGDSFGWPFQIKNSGSATITLTGSPYVQISGSTLFGINQPMNDTVLPGETRTFLITTITDASTSEGKKTINVTIPYNDGADKTFAFTYYCYVYAMSETYGFNKKWGTNGSGNGEFDGAKSICIDHTGDIYVLDSNNYRVQKFDSSGTYVSQFGTSGSNDGEFEWDANDIAVDHSGNIYVIDSGNNRIQKFDSSFNFKKKWGSPGTGDSMFGDMNDCQIVIDSSNNIYVTDPDNYRIQKFDSNGNFLLKFGSYGYGDSQFTYIDSIAIDSSNTIYVFSGYELKKFNSSGNFISKIFLYDVGVGMGMTGYEKVVIDSSNKIYFSTGEYIYKLDPQYKILSRIGEYGKNDGEFDSISDLAITADGTSIFAVDEYLDRVQKFNKE